MARPRKEFDVDQFEKLCQIQATEQEIANWFDMTDDTLNARCKETYGKCFSDTYKKYSDTGKMSLRRKQVQIALNGNVTMLIWLGKQMLGQSDKQEQKMNVEFAGDINLDKKYQEHATSILRRFGSDLP